MKFIHAVLLTLAIGLALPVFSVRAENEFPENFFLFSGRMQKLSDEHPFYKAKKTLFVSAPLDIGMGKVVASRTVNTTFSEPVGDPRYKTFDVYAGQMSLTIEGDYDKDTGSMRGTAVVKIDLVSERESADPSVKPQSGKFVENSQGKFRGQVVGDRALLKMTLRDENGLPVNFSVAYQIGGLAPKAAEAAAPEAGTDSGARISAATGQVEWRRDDDEDGWHLVELGQSLPVRAHIRTQEDSSAVIGFADMSTFIVKPESEVVVTTPPEKDSKIKLVAGNIWVNVKKMLKDGSMEVEMNQAVAGIKGTTFVASEAGGRSTIRTVEGEVMLTAADGSTARLGSGVQGATDGKQIEESRFDVLAEIDAWGTVPTDWAAMEAAVPDDGEPAEPVRDEGADSSKSNVLPLVFVAAVVATAVGVYAIRRKKR